MKKGSILKNYFGYENKYIQQGYNFVIGVDEAGRGPLAGPVVACAVSLKSSSLLGRGVRGERKIQDFSLIRPTATFSLREKGNYNKIRDSKLMTEKQREELYDFITEHFYFGIGICDHKIIDRINILEATFLAMKKAVTQLKLKNAKHIILVDGNKIIPNCSYNQKAIIHGDKLIKSISAASIVAKVTRDRIMREMDKKYPMYYFAKHKGYGTKMHREMIKKHGFCEIHRRSFNVR
jgi:ribonuclease HII